jgi:Sulfotransferase domain
LGSKARIIFILRNPVDRVISAYYFGKQRGALNVDMTFEEFYRELLKNENINHPLFNVLSTGKYSEYLMKYLALFESNQIKIILFEDLVDHTKEIVINIIEWVGLDPDIYSNYDFETSNQTHFVRSRLLRMCYVKLRKVVLKNTMEFKLLYRVLQNMRDIFKPLYMKFNTKSLIKEEISTDIMDSLRDYYFEEPDKLSQIVNVDVPWNVSRTRTKGMSNG